jgi:hypothetical protein
VIQSKLTWNGQQARQVVLDAGWDGLRRAVVFFWNTLINVLNVSNPGERVKRKRNTKAGVKGSTYTIYPHPSRPGEPPRARTAWLKGHVQYELEKETLSARVGVGLAARYGLYLELGTRKMAARPWLFSTLKKILPQLQILAGSGGNTA